MSGLDDDSDSSTDSVIRGLHEFGFKHMAGNSIINVQVNPIYYVYHADESPTTAEKLKECLEKRCTMYLKIYEYLISIKNKYDTEISSLDMAMTEAKLLFFKFRICEEKNVRYSAGYSVHTSSTWVKTLKKLKKEYDILRHSLEKERKSVLKGIDEFNYFLLRKLHLQDNAPAQPRISTDFEAFYSKLEALYKKVSDFVYSCNSLQDKKDKKVNPKYTVKQSIADAFDYNEPALEPRDDKYLMRLDIESEFLALLNVFSFIMYYTRKFRTEKNTLHKTLVDAKIFILKVHFFNLHKIPFCTATIFSDKNDTTAVFDFIQAIHLDVESTELSQMKSALSKANDDFQKFIEDNLKSDQVIRDLIKLDRLGLDGKYLILCEKVKSYVELIGDTCDKKVLNDNSVLV